MSKFKYSCDIGGFNEQVHVDIDVTIESAIDKEDYQKLKEAFEVIERVSFKYFPEQLPNQPEAKN